MGPVVITLTKQTLIFDEPELLSLLTQHPKEFMRANKRGKGYKRAQAARRREQKKWEDQEVDASRKNRS